MLADRVRAVVESGGSNDAVAALYAPDALLDANVPTWRFQCKGIADIAAQLQQWYGESPARVEEIREWPAGSGSVVEYVERGTMGGQPVSSRALNLLFVEEGKVVRHIYYCTGPWDPDTEARHKLEAPMYEP